MRYLATCLLLTACASGPVITLPPQPIAKPDFEAHFNKAPFRTQTGDGVSDDGKWWVEQKAGFNRATIVGGGRSDGYSLRLHTEPGDSNISGSLTSERNDIALPQKDTDGYEGKESWWAHSIMFPDDYVSPTNGWNVVFDFHDSRNQGGQANFHVFAGTTLSFRGHAGPEVVYDSAKGNQYSYGADIGILKKNFWYDFVYHVKWTSKADGFFKAWVNGELKLDHKGPTLYDGHGVYLKLANYHSAHGKASSVVHDRVIRGATREAVELK